MEDIEERLKGQLLLQRKTPEKESRKLSLKPKSALLNKPSRLSKNLKSQRSIIHLQAYQKDKLSSNGEKDGELDVKAAIAASKTDAKTPKAEVNSQS